MLETEKNEKNNTVGKLKTLFKKIKNFDQLKEEVFEMKKTFQQTYEDVNSIKNPIIFSSYDFQDYLIYGTNNGFVKIRKFPEMELVNKSNPFNNGKSIQCLCLSLDKKYCFAWSSSNEIAVISNSFTK